ncbi:MAG: PhzF family phenazine biosynthesis protein [Acidimicrobiales bacterium]
MSTPISGAAAAAPPAGTAPVEVPLWWVDAFGDGPFTGNPAAVCLLERPADERWMQRLATELHLSETAYVWPVDGSDAGADGGGERSLRWFTPAAEVDLCGHATLAAAHALSEAGRAADGSILRFRTRSGLLVADVAGPMVSIDLPADSPRPLDRPGGTGTDRPPFGLPAEPVAYALGRTDLVVELGDAAEVAAAEPDLGSIAAAPYRGVIVTAAGGPDGADYVLRFFGPAVGVPEDPVTGSAQCVLAPYWAARLGRSRFAVRQLSLRGGWLEVVLAGDRVRLAGRAATVLTGRVRPAYDEGPASPGPAGRGVC